MSNIAILGWGSLLWRPESLAMTSAWNPDGPLLPLEFARLSGNNTLTLVIHPASPPQQTYWVTSACPRSLMRGKTSASERDARH